MPFAVIDGKPVLEIAKRPVRLPVVAQARSSCFYGLRQDISNGPSQRLGMSGLVGKRTGGASGESLARHSASQT